MAGISDQAATALSPFLSGDLQGMSYWGHEMGMQQYQFFDQYRNPIWETSGSGAMSMARSWSGQMPGLAFTQAGSNWGAAAGLLGTQNQEIIGTFMDGGTRGLQWAASQKALDAYSGIPFKDNNRNVGAAYLLIAQIGSDAVYALQPTWLRIDPEDCKARSNLGNAYYEQERYPDAMYEYERALELDGDCYPALFNIAVAFADARIYREAIVYWEKVIAVAPGTDAARQARENVTLLNTLMSEGGK